MKMKRLIIYITAAAMLAAFLIVPASAQHSSKVFVDNLPVTLTANPENRNGSIFIPFRAIAQAINVNVEWNGAEKKITAISEGKEVILQIGNIYAKIKESRETVYIPSYKQDILNKAIQYIYNNFSNESISVSHLAELSQISEVHFRRIFKEIHSVSPIKYITNLRINHAKDLLKYKNQSITNISIAVGFQNVYYFSKVFKDETGMTPSEYRKTLSDNFNYYI
jgi:AraC-like DNA-binding protein